MKKIFKDTSGSRMQPLSSKKNGEVDCPVKADAQGYLYYKSRLPYTERTVYETVKKGMLNGNGRISLDAIPTKRCEDIFNAVLLDTPMLFYINGCSVIESGRKTDLMPKYMIPNSEYRRYEQNCVKALRLLCEKTGRSTWDNLLSLHEGLISRIRYREGRQEAHDIIGPLLQHEGVCDGIAKSVKAACDLMCIPCIVVRGEARRENGEIGSHAWNVIKVDEDWRFFDFTFDITLNQSNPCRKIQRMDYFSITYEEMSVDHFKWSASIESFNKGKDYFERNNMIVRRQEELDRIICNSCSKPLERAYKVDRSWKNYENGMALKVDVNKLIEKTGFSCRYSFAFNEGQRVGYVRIE